MAFLKGKKILITGVSSKLSIAAGIASAMHREGAELAFTYQNEKLKDRVVEMAAVNWGTDASMCFPLDVTSDSEIESLFDQLHGKWNNFDGFVHSLAFAPREQLEGQFVDVTTREGFALAHDISSYSLTAPAKKSKGMLNEDSSILAMTYLGSVLTMPNYNVMGVAKASLEASIRYLARDFGKQSCRVNGISAGPIKTLAASGIGRFREMLKYNAHRTPIGRNITIDEVGNTAAFLASNLSSGISGQIIYVDGGFNSTAMEDFE